jgi:signal transduction histidine kinase
VRRSWWLRFGSDERVLDATLTVAAVLVPVLTLLASGDDPATRDLARPRYVVLLLLLILLHGAPVWWRRRAPWRTLFAVLAAAVGYVVVVLVTALETAAVGPLYAGLGAEIIAVYTVAAYARPAWATLAAPIAAAVTGSLTLTLVSVRESAETRQNSIAVLVFVVVVIAGPWFAGYLPPWLLGVLLRRRRRRTLAAEEEALAAAARAAAAAAQAQRMRFAAGLHASVLDPARRLVRAADAGRADAGRAGAAHGSAAVGAVGAVDRVTAEARAGLAAMRELLGALQPEDQAAGSAPPRGTADLADLCAEYRAGGREVTLRAGPPPHPLPVAVDLSGYRIVDAALDTSDADPCAVTLVYADEHLHVTLTGVPSATHGVVAAQIRARVAAVGGGVEFDPAGTVAVRLPAVREEVPASLSE